MTRLELRQRVLRSLNDVDGVFHTASEINTALDDGLEVLAEEAPSLKRTFTVPRRPGVCVYPLSGLGANIMAPYRLWLPDLERRLDPVTLTDLDARHTHWQTVTGDPYWWFLVDWRAFGVWPIPATGGGWLQVDCYVWPDALQDDDDEPELHEQDHDALVTYGELDGACKEWDAARAAQRLTHFGQRWGRARAQASVAQVQARHWVRGERS